MCQLTGPRRFDGCKSTLALLDAAVVTAQQPRAVAGCRGYGGGVTWCGRRVSMSHHHTPTGAFGVGDDLGGGAGSAARPLGGGGGGEGGATTLTVVTTSGGGDVRDDDHRSYRMTLVTVHKVCTAAAGGARNNGARGDGGEISFWLARTWRRLGEGLMQKARRWLRGEGAAALESPTAPPAAAEVPVCRFCLDEADLGAQEGQLISPCACSGSQAYVHVRCLRTWHDTAYGLSDVKLSDSFRCQVCRQRFEALPSRPWRTIACTYTPPFVHYFSAFMVVIVVGVGATEYT